MADVVPFHSPAGAAVEGPALSIADESDIVKARLAGDGGPAMGAATSTDGTLAFCTSPGEWTVLGDQPAGAVDVTHVRLVFRLSGDDATRLLAKVCSLDFGDDMFPDGRAARTSVAGVATEVVRDDRDGERSYLLVCSRSFGGYLWDVLVGQAEEFTRPAPSI